MCTDGCSPQSIASEHVNVEVLAGDRDERREIPFLPGRRQSWKGILLAEAHVGDHAGARYEVQSDDLPKSVDKWKSR
jgi:hypothetical protein